MNLRIVERSTKLLRLGPEIVNGALHVAENVSGWDEDVVNADTLASIRHVESVVEDGVSLVVGESVQVPVGVGSQHDGGLHLGGGGDHAEVPVLALNSVGDVGDDLTGEALLAIRVSDVEGDAALGVTDHGEVAPIPAVRSTVEGVNTLGVTGGRVLVGQDVEGLAVNLEGAVLDTVGVTSGNTTEVRMLLVNAVVGSIVEATNDVSRNTILVVDDQVGDGGTVGNEGRLKTITVEPVLAILIGTLGPRRRIGRSGGEERGRSGQCEKLAEHCCGVRCILLFESWRWFQGPIECLLKLAEK